MTVRTLLMMAVVGAIATTGAGYAQEPTPETDRVLVPVLWEGEGVGGSFWKSELRISNSGATAAIVAPGSPNCPFELCDKTLAANTVVRYGSTVGSTNPGEYFVVERTHAADIHFLLRVWNTSIETESFGTTIPVVRHDEWSTSTIELLHVPVDDLFRVTVRAYEYEPSNALSLHLTVRSETGTEVLAETTLDLRGGDSQSTYPLVPSYAMLTNLLDRFPQLRGQQFVRVRLEPSAARQYWAFVSVTSNLTHHVTVITPE